MTASHKYGYSPEPTRVVPGVYALPREPRQLGHIRHFCIAYQATTPSVKDVFGATQDIIKRKLSEFDAMSIDENSRLGRYLLYLRNASAGEASFKEFMRTIEEPLPVIYFIRGMNVVMERKHYLPIMRRDAGIEDFLDTHRSLLIDFRLTTKDKESSTSPLHLPEQALTQTLLSEGVCESERMQVVPPDYDKKRAARIARFLYAHKDELPDLSKQALQWRANTILEKIIPVFPEQPQIQIALIPVSMVPQKARPFVPNNN